MKTIYKILLALSVAGSLSVLTADTGADLYKKCMACHGINAEKKALGKSEIIKGWEASKTIASLKGYKDGTYGGPMKAMMKGQVTNLSDADIEALAQYIESQK